MNKTKDELLDHYAREATEVRQFVQLDGWHGFLPDDLMRPDADGDWVCVQTTTDLRASDEELVVRLQIPLGASEADVLRLLEKLRHQILIGALEWAQEANGRPAIYWTRDVDSMPESRRTALLHHLRSLPHRVHAKVVRS